MDDIYLDNDYEAEYTVTRKNASTGADEAATGLTGLTVRISATDGGSALGTTPSLTGAASERGALGIFYKEFDGDTLRTVLASSYVGVRVWVIFGDGTNVLTSNPVTVRGTRRAA